MPKTDFTDGDPSVPILPTVLTAAFMNALQNHRHDGGSEDGSFPLDYALDVGAGNAYAITLVPALGGHVTGMPIRFTAGRTNTGAATIAVNSLPAVNILRPDGSSLSAGDLVSGRLYTIFYDGSAYRFCGMPGISYRVLTAMSLYIAPTGSDNADGSSISPWLTVGKALAYLADKRIDRQSGGAVSIIYKDGAYSISSAITPQHSDGPGITFTGQNSYTKSMSSIVSSSGTAGARSVVLQLDSTTNIAVNDWCTVGAVSGGTYNHAILGHHKITAVNAAASQITVAVKNLFATAPSGSISGTVTVNKTIVTCSGCTGFLLSDALAAINKMSIIGSAASSVKGVHVMPGGNLLGASGLAIANFGDCFMNQGGEAYCADLWLSNYDLVSGNGLQVNAGGKMRVNMLVATGMPTNGIYMKGASRLVTDAITASSNATGLRCENMSHVASSDGNIKGNTGTGVIASIGSNVNLGPGATYVDNGTPASPAVGDTGGNHGAMILSV